MKRLLESIFMTRNYLYLSLYITATTFYSFGLFGAEIDVTERSFSTECQEALYSILGRPLTSEARSLKQSKNSIQSTLDTLKTISPARTDEVKIEIFATIPAEMMDELQIFQRSRYESPYDFTRQKFDYRTFYFRRPSLSALELSNIANRSVRGREFHRIVLHFKNGDTLSTKIIRGSRQTVQPDFRGLEYLLHEIKAGTRKGSDGKPLDLADITVAETIHNHPFAYFVRITPKLPRLVRTNENQRVTFPWIWMGGMSPSSQDELSTEVGLAGAFRNVLGHEARHSLERIILRETVLNSQAQTISVDVGVKFYGSPEYPKFFRDGSEIRNIW